MNLNLFKFTNKYFYVFLDSLESLYAFIFQFKIIYNYEADLSKIVAMWS